MKSLYLQHHGVKGMKWGVRRYQNYDGTRIKEYDFGKVENGYKTMNEIGEKDYYTKSGSNVYRVTSEKNESMNDVKYVTLRPRDATTYAVSDEFAANPNSTYVTTYKANQLKVAGEKATLDIIEKAGKIKISDFIDDDGLVYNGKENILDVFAKRDKNSKYIEEARRRGYDAVTDLVDGVGKYGIAYADTPIIIVNTSKLTKVGQHTVDEWLS